MPNEVFFTIEYKIRTKIETNVNNQHVQSYWKTCDIHNFDVKLQMLQKEFPSEELEHTANSLGAYIETHGGLILRTLS